MGEGMPLVFVSPLPKRVVHCPQAYVELNCKLAALLEIGKIVDGLALQLVADTWSY